MNTILLVFAHPDDESFATGVTIAKYSALNWRIHLICATAGDAGESGPYEDLAKDELGVIRKTELDKAAEVLGISGITHLDYKDGKLNEVETGELEDKIYRKMVELSPQIVITFDTLGISNHPDHIKICYATTYAFQKYTQELAETRQFVLDVNAKVEVKKRHFASQHMYALRQKSFSEVVESNVEPKLYYACMPNSVAEYLKKKKIIPDESFGKLWIGEQDKKITTVIDAPKYIMTKLKALAAHKSQSADVDRFYEDESNPNISKEFFILRMQGDTEVFMGKGDDVEDKL